MGVELNVQKLNPGSLCHIYNRGNNKEILFRDSKDYNRFISLWIRHISPRVFTYCYCLLPNHFHFLIRLKEDYFLKETINMPLHPERSFANLFSAYAKYYNKKYERTGSLFQERFRRKEILTESYFTKIVGYILTNPFKHKICDSSAEYLYSSYNSLLHSDPGFICSEEVINWFSGKQNFIEFIKDYELELSDQGEFRV